MRGPSSGLRTGDVSPRMEAPMAKKKAKGVLEKITDAVSSGAEVVVDAGSRAVHAIGDLLPAAKTAPKREAKPKVAAKPQPKAAVKAEAEAAPAASAAKPAKKPA